MLLDKGPFPVNKHNNKGSSSLAGGQDDRSSRGSSREARPTANFDPRSAYRSQARQLMPQLPQISQARGTILRNQYNETRNTNNSNSSKSPRPGRRGAAQGGNPQRGFRDSVSGGNGNAA